MAKKILFILCLGLNYLGAFAQLGQWTWMHGDSTPNASGIYGIQGVSDVNNTPPARYEAAEWTGIDGIFWLYGGGGCDSVAGGCIGLGGQNSDLWKYNPNTNEWTWVKGSPISNSELPKHGPIGVFTDSATPGLRAFACVTWTTPNGNLWLFGGQSTVGNHMNDLWQYDISLNQWAFMAGDQISNQPGRYGIKGVPDPANKPKGRSESATGWVDNNGDLWLFGGGIIGQYFNDLWRYDVGSGEWIWESGDSTVNAMGQYGVKGQFASNNVPGARTVYAHWMDKIDNKLWLWGGSEDINFSHNDLWCYDIALKQWAWMSGDSIAGFGDTLACYGKLGMFSPCNKPGPRFETRTSWTDKDGDMWLSGGLNFLNENSALWMYDKNRAQWIWVSGSISVDTGYWGVKGVPNSNNRPPAFTGANPWVDTAGNFWAFGGVSTMVSGLNPYNSLWKYELPDKNLFSDAQPPLPDFIADTTRGCVPFTVNFTDLTDSVFKTCNNQFQYFWDFGDGNTDTVVSPSYTYASPGIYSVKLKVSSLCNGIDSITKVGYIEVDTFPIADINPDSLSICQGEFINLSNNSPFTNYLYRWDFGDGSIDTVQSSPIHIYATSGNYILKLKVSNTCGSDSDQIMVDIYSLPSVNLGEDTICVLGVLTLDAGSFADYNWSTGDTASMIGISNSGSFSVQVADSNGCQDMDTINVIFTSQPNLVVLDSVALCEGERIQITATGGIFYNWSPNIGISQTDVPNPILSPSNTTIYTIIASNNCALQDTEKVKVEVLACEIFIPNAFSPNSDGDNDIFIIRGDGIDNLIINIYDRWGKKVFETRSSGVTLSGVEGWDGLINGKPGNKGVYVYVITGSFISGNEIDLKGNVTLIR